MERFEGPKKKSEGITRRRFIEGVAALGALTLAEHKLSEGGKERTQQDILRESAQPEDITFLNVPKNPKPYNTGTLEGKKFGYPLNQYLGIEKKAGAVEEIDFKYQLANLWKRKIDVMRGDEDIEEFGFHNEGVLQAAESVFASYKVPESGKGTTIEEYRRSIDTTIEHVDRVLDWKPVEKYFALKESQSRFLETAAQNVDADLLLAYAMTELMPSEDGSFNTMAFDFLLRNAGRGYIECIPALGDKHMSFGPYQFTSMALSAPFGTSKSNQTPHGATLIDRQLRHSVLPPNVVSLKGDDHSRAAYMFAIYNLTLLVKDLGEERTHKLIPHFAALSDVIGDYVVAAHHKPKDARQAFTAYAENVLAGSKTSPSFAQLCDRENQKYVQKTRSNLSALRAGV